MWLVPYKLTFPVSTGGILNVYHEDCTSDPGNYDSNPHKGLVYSVSTVASGLAEQVTSFEYHTDSCPEKYLMSMGYVFRAGLFSVFL